VSRIRAALLFRMPGERWEDLLVEGQAAQVDAALWEAASYGVDGPALAAAIRRTIDGTGGEQLMADRDEGPTLAEFCEREGLHLMSWQRDLVERILSGEQIAWHPERLAGRATILRVSAGFIHYRDGWKDGHAAAKGDK